MQSLRIERQTIERQQILKLEKTLKVLALLEETEHFCGCGQEKVAKIVQCGEPRFDKGRLNSQAAFSLPSRVRSCK